MSRNARWIMGGVAVLVLAVIAARLSLPAVPGWFVHSDPPLRCDVIVVVGSNPEGSTEAEAARLWRAGWGTFVLCAGRQVAWHVTEEAVMARHLRALGIPAARILTVDIPFSHAPDAGTMREEHRVVLPFLRRRGFHSALVVSGALESRRRAFLLRSWRRAGLRVAVDPIPEPGFHTTCWWRYKMDTKRIVGEALGWLTLPFGG